MTAQLWFAKTGNSIFSFHGQTNVFEPFAEKIANTSFYFIQVAFIIHAHKIVFPNSKGKKNEQISRFRPQRIPGALKFPKEMQITHEKLYCLVLQTHFFPSA